VVFLDYRSGENKELKKTMNGNDNVKRIIIDSELHARFKAATAARKETMKAVVEKMIDDYLLHASLE